MSKKKAVICTAMFAIILGSIIIATILISPHDSETTFFEIFSPFIVGYWTYECIEKFYYWLRKND